MLVLLDKLNTNGASEELVNLVVKKYRDENQDSLIKKNVGITYYLTADDITYKLVEEMMKNEHEIGTRIDSMDIYDKLLEFYHAVRNKGSLDLKQKAEWQQSSLYVFNGELVDRDAPGNILYGYVGKVYGFPDMVLSGAAGVAQIRAGTSALPWVITSFGDDPMDQTNINRGIDFYNEYH